MDSNLPMNSTNEPEPAALPEVPTSNAKVTISKTPEGKWEGSAEVSDKHTHLLIGGIVAVASMGIPFWGLPQVIKALAPGAMSGSEMVSILIPLGLMPIVCFVIYVIFGTWRRRN